MKTDNLKIEFTSVKKERNLFYSRSISSLSFWGLPIGGIAYLILVNTIGLSILTIIISIFIGWSANWLFTKVRMYKIYGRPGKPALAIFEADDTNFSITLGNELKKFNYTDISRVESLGNFAIIWLKKTYSFNNKSIGIPIYSTAFVTMSRSDFISKLNSKNSSTIDFYPVIDPV